MKPRPALKAPRDKRAVCQKCVTFKLNKNCRIKDPKLVVLDAKEQNLPLTDNPAFCAYYRCERGRAHAVKQLNATAKGGNHQIKFHDIKPIKGVDASIIKTGFVDKAGKLYAYKNLDPKSLQVMPTGQKLSEKELEGK